MPARYKRSTKARTTPTGKKAVPTGTAADLNAMTMAGLFADEDKAREFMEAQRWPDGPVCPHCGSVKAYRLTGKPGSKSPVRKGVCKCSDCRKQFTVKVGTVFEDSKLPIRYWLYVAHLMTSSKKGVSSHQIARELSITVKSAWFMTMRLREAMKQEPVAGMLKGEVEVDEVYLGGKPRHTTIHGKGGEKKVVSDENAKRSLRISMTKNPAFHKIPNGDYGLSEWYPNAKHPKRDKSEENGSGEVDHEEVADHVAEILKDVEPLKKEESQPAKK